jgi:ribosomal protein S6--L-glutamate ligase
MRAAVVSLGSTSSKWTIDALKKYFKKVDAIDLRKVEVDLGSDSPVVLYQGKPVLDYDCIYLKGSFRYIQVLRSIATVLENKAYMPISPAAFTIGHDKLLTHLTLQQNRIPMPETYISVNPSAAKAILERISYPVVMKFPSGTQGKGVMFADSYNSATSMFDALSVLNQPVIIQKYIETGGKDIRVIVAGDKVIAAMERQAVEGEKRANIHAGGKGRAVELDGRTKDIAIQTAKAIGADICAVDILRSSKGPLVIEVNLSPGLQGITEATKMNVADRIAKYLYEQANRCKGGMVPDVKSEKGDDTNTIITGIDLDCGRILLPEIVTKMSGLGADDEILITASKHSVSITKSCMPKTIKVKKKRAR